MANFTKEELMQEAMRRGLNVVNVSQPSESGQFSKQELLAEAKRRGLKITVSSNEKPTLLETGLDKINKESGGALNPLYKLANTYPAKLIASAGQGVGQTEEDFLRGAGNLGINLANALGANISPFEKAKISDKADIPIAATAGEIGASLALPSLGIAKKVKSVSAIPKALKSILGNSAEGAAYGSIFGASNPDSDIKQNAGIGALAGVGGSALEGLLKLPSAVVNKYVKNLSEKASHGLIRTPEEVADISEKVAPIVGDARLDFGSLLGDKESSRYYHSALENTFGGGKKVKINQYKLIGAADKEADKILSDLRGGVDFEDVPEALTSRVRDLKNLYTSNARDMFNSITKDAEERGLVIPDLPKSKAYAAQILKEERDVLASGIKGELRNTLRKLGVEPINVNKEGSQSKGTEYSKAHFSHSNLGKLGDELAAKQEYRSASVANKLQEKLREDIEDALSASGNKDLFDRWQAAKTYFSNNVAPFRQKSLTKILAEEKPNSQLAKELISGKNKAVLGMLDQDTRNLIGHEQFSKYLKDNGIGDKSISVNNLMNAYNRLINQRNEAILPPAIQKRIESLNALNKSIGEARITVNTPPTGRINKPLIKDAQKYGAVLSAGVLGSPLLAALGVGAKYGIDKAAEKALTSNFLRNAYINQGVKSPNTSPFINALIRALTQQTTKGNQQ